ncbi:hypothetical protein DIPPA_55731 [Diplonema papillatum]|nr:hypothetical protein DIPPA_55731 [Diplonema papillatum]
MGAPIQIHPRSRLLNVEPHFSGFRGPCWLQKQVSSRTPHHRTIFLSKPPLFLGIVSYTLHIFPSALLVRRYCIFGEGEPRRTTTQAPVPRAGVVRAGVAQRDLPERGAVLPPGLCSRQEAELHLTRAGSRAMFISSGRTTATCDQHTIYLTKRPCFAADCTPGVNEQLCGVCCMIRPTRKPIDEKNIINLLLQARGNTRETC